MANVTRKIGLSLGADICWPICYEHILGNLKLAVPWNGDTVGVVIADHGAVGQEHHPVRVRGPARVVRHHDDGLAELGHRVAQERQQVGGSIGVQVAGGLIGEDEGRFVDQRPGARDALLLAAGHLARPVLQPVGDAQLLHQVAEPVLVNLVTRQGRGQGDVLGRGQRRNQVEGLEHEADAVPPQPGQPAVVQLPDVLAVHERLPGGRPVQARHAVHERRLARARRAHDGGKPAALKRDRDVGQRVHGSLA